ncbi:DUF418 domain-containing protein [Glycomyces sp. NPDC048151]|uniref:DUF418 domain-containing protein n=1 Tax=Glycomyces sp. NPDC048151 TaxID=3364002 RepID=UPI0037170D17
MSHPAAAGLLAPPDFAAARTRSLAPDLARGLMLLAICLAHVRGFITDWGTGAVNATAEFAGVYLLDNQARVMFIVLFGYGLGQLAYRRAAQGAEWTDVRKLMRRRGFWLLVIGLLHMVLLVPIDFISTYGLTLLLFAGLVRRGDKAILWTALATLVLAVGFTAWTEVDLLRRYAAGELSLEMMFTGSYGEHVVLGLGVASFKVVLSVFGVVPGMLLGLWAARRHVLDDPAAHLGLLRGLAFGALGFALAARLPYALVQTGHWDAEPGTMWWLSAVLHSAGGYAGGVGGAALIGLVASRMTRPGPVATAVAALGQRSMTFYLFQSAAILVLFYPFTLDLAGDVSMAGSFAVAFAIWLATLLIAEWMRRAGRRGPFETLLRRLSEKR